MLLSDLFSYIATLDSAAINIGGDDEGMIAGKHYPKVINAINLAMIELYTEFPIRERSLAIQLYEHITEYELHPDYAQTNTASTEIYKYIQDSSFDPFIENNVIKIERVYDEEGTELSINKDEDIYSLYTPAYNILQHPYPSDDNAIVLTYRSLPETISVDVVPETYEVLLPRQLLNLALIFINHKLLSSVNKQESLAKLNEYASALNLAKSRSLFRQDDFPNDKIEAMGWE